MATGRKRSVLSYIPGLTNNAVLRLIIFLSVAYVLMGLTWGVMMLVYQDGANFNQASVFLRQNQKKQLNLRWMIK